MHTYVLIVISVCLYSASAHQHSVPALIWSPESSLNELPKVQGNEPVSTSDFFHKYLNQLDSGIIYLQDKLHVNDFTKFADVYSLDSDGGAFKNIKGLMEEHSSLELSQVADPYKAIEQMTNSFTGDVHTVKSLDEVQGLNLSNDKKFLVIVHLDPVSGSADAESVIQKNDNLVGAVSKHLQLQKIKYTALYTGQAAPEQQVQKAGIRSNRRLLDVVDKFNGTFINVSVSDGQIFAFLREATVVVVLPDKRNITFNLTVEPEIASKSTRDNKTAQIIFDFPKTTVNGSEYNVSIWTEAQKHGDRWTMTVTLRVEGGVYPNNISIANASLSKGEMDWTVPIIYSWHCTEQVMFIDTVHSPEFKDHKGSYVMFTGYQVQPFFIQRDRFFDAQDCVPYFTTGTWMFLFSAIFLVSILIFGVLMVLSLSTMDKYDDPKGKTISVTQSSD